MIANNKIEGNIPSLNELIERVKKLEETVFIDKDKETIRCIAFTDNDTRILTHNGFKKIDKIKDNTIRLFQNSANIKKYLDSHCTYYKLKVKVKRVKVTYEYLDDVEEINGEEFEEDE